MQDWGIDYYEEGKGCCLKCPDAYAGCLCFECKCRKCFWYNIEGVCDLVAELKRDAKEKFKEQLRLEQLKKNKEYQELLRYNKEIELIIKKKKGIISYYNCIKCHNEFVSEVELNKPTCPICRGFFK